ncbi:hypothetical protein [Methanomethylophilus alvi]|uniref:hypothetical protein n=1 Tax=Methanomethylophilus alvi TaxID=1291540 RepID=UPI0037DDA605
MANHLLEKTFTSDRYFELRHKLECDFHEDYDYSNAVAHGEIQSVKDCGNHTLEIDTIGYYDDGESTPYRVTIQYIDDGEHGPKHSRNNDEFHGYWFDEFPVCEQDHLSFDNCVFNVDVQIKNSKGIIFQNCFFLHEVAIEEGRSNIICFEQCHFSKSLDIFDVKTDNLFIRNCNIDYALTILNCKVEKWTSIYRNFIKLGFHVRDSVFLGDECLFDNIKTGYELEINKCTFETTTEMTNCLIESLDVEESNFNNLNVDNISTHTYFTLENLSQNQSNDDFKEFDEGPILVMGDDSALDDPFVNRIKKFEAAMDSAFQKKSAIEFVRSIFNGLVSISSIKSTVLAFGCCRAYDEVTIMDMDAGRYFSHDSGPVRTLIEGRKKQDFDFQFLDLRCSIFYENVEIHNIYRFIDLSETKFKDDADIDEEYLNVTNGWPIRRISKDTRLIDYSSRTLQELFMSCNRDEYDRRERLYLDIKTQERGDCRFIFKIGYVAHEVLSNYGKSPLRVLTVMAAIIGVFSLLLFGVGYDSIGNCIIDSCSSFFTIGLGISHLDELTVKTLVVLEGAIGFALMSYFIVVLCDRRK